MFWRPWSGRLYLVATEEELQAVKQLVLITDQVGWDHERLRAALRWLTRGHIGRRRRPYAAAELGTPWQDTPSPLRPAWRCRGAYLDGEPVFEVDYLICKRCALGWVEEPHTHEEFQRLGLAAAGLAQLRFECPHLAWHTLGGHMFQARPFWDVVGVGVPGAYQQRELCEHLSPGRLGGRH